jgi:hypothetical protein
MQEISRILWNRKVQHCVHEIPSLVRILDWMNPVYNLKPYLSKIHFNIIFQSTTRSSEWFLSSKFSNQNSYYYLLSQVFFLPWYFSWASGEPLHSGFKSQLVALSLWYVMFLVWQFFVGNLLLLLLVLFFKYLIMHKQIFVHLSFSCADSVIGSCSCWVSTLNKELKYCCYYSYHHQHHILGFGAMWIRRLIPTIPRNIFSPFRGRRWRQYAKTQTKSLSSPPWKPQISHLLYITILVPL